MDRSIESHIGDFSLGHCFTLFIDWILDISQILNKLHIYPFMREAELFVPMLSKAASLRNLNVKISPLYVSRESTWLASLKSWNKNSFELLITNYGFTVTDIFRVLNLNYPEIIKTEWANFKVKDLPVDILNKIRIYLLSDDIVDHINDEINLRHQYLIGFLKQETNLLKNSVCVDLGFRGSISLNIENSLSNAGIKSTVTHLLAFGSTSLGYLQDKGLDIRSFYSPDNKSQNLVGCIHKSLKPIEQCILGQTGSTLAYRKFSNSYTTLLDDVVIPADEIKSKTKIRESILKFQSSWYETYNQSHSRSVFLKSPDEKSKALEKVYRLINSPTYEEANFLGNLHHDINAGSAQLSMICSNEDEKLLTRLGSNQKFLKVCRIYGIHWPQGVIARNKFPSIIDQKVNQNTEDCYEAAFHELLSLIKVQEIKSIIVYGAGEAGKSLILKAKKLSISVECFVDQNKALWGLKLDGLEILSLEDAINKFIGTPIVIASFEFFKQIEFTITDKLQRLDYNVKIFSVNNLIDD